MPHQKDFSSVSPSAKSLLLMKGLTNIPFARQMAELMQGPEVFGFDFENKDFWFWIRVLHFEARYWSIDQLMKQAGGNNVLELSSGYSFRGLDMCMGNPDIHYIDTDLDEVIANKQHLVQVARVDRAVRGKYEILGLNALDEGAFDNIAARFQQGPLTIVNEGLLMYLDYKEKKQLCSCIHGILKARGGCWITADIYLKRDMESLAKMPQSKSELSFMQRHQVEENKFDSYESASAFFNDQGFEVVTEAVTDYSSLSVLPELLKVMPEQVRNSKDTPPKIQATWLLRVKQES